MRGPGSSSGALGRWRAPPQGLFHLPGSRPSSPSLSTAPRVPALPHLWAWLGWTLLTSPQAPLSAVRTPWAGQQGHCTGPGLAEATEGCWAVGPGLKDTSLGGLSCRCHMWWKDRPADPHLMPGEQAPWGPLDGELLQAFWGPVFLLAMGHSGDPHQVGEEQGRPLPRECWALELPAAFGEPPGQCRRPTVEAHRGDSGSEGREAPELGMQELSLEVQIGLLTGDTDRWRNRLGAE